MPDIFVPQDTTGMTSYFRTAANKGMIIRFTFEYTDQNRSRLLDYETPDQLIAYLKTQNVLDKFATWAEKKGLKRRNLMLLKSKKLFETALYGNIVYNMLGMEAYIKYLNESDKTVLKALEVLKDGKSFPEAPAPKNDLTNDEKKVAQLDKPAKKTVLPPTTYDVVYQLA